MKPEKLLATQVAQYLQLQYPNVLWRFDLAADMKLTPGQARRHKALNPHRGYPDLFILEPRRGWYGLFIELKAKSVYLKNGQLTSNEHVQEQAIFLAELRARGYKAEFGCGFNEIVAIIEKYFW